MGEHIVKVQIDELGTVRIIGDGVIEEMSIDKLAAYAERSIQGDSQRHMKSLAEAIQFFSRSKAPQKIEFVIPAENL